MYHWNRTDGYNTVSANGWIRTGDWFEEVRTWGEGVRIRDVRGEVEFKMVGKNIVIHTTTVQVLFEGRNR